MMGRMLQPQTAKQGSMSKLMLLLVQALRRDPDSTACARGLKRVRALVAAKESGNTAFKERRWGDAHRHYSDALARYTPGGGNEAFFAQCFSNRWAPLNGSSTMFCCACLRRSSDSQPPVCSPFFASHKCGMHAHISCTSRANRVAATVGILRLWPHWHTD